MSGDERSDSSLDGDGLLCTGVGDTRGLCTSKKVNHEWEGKPYCYCCFRQVCKRKKQKSQREIDRQRARLIQTREEKRLRRAAYRVEKEKLRLERHKSRADKKQEELQRKRTAAPEAPVPPRELSLEEKKQAWITWVRQHPNVSEEELHQAIEKAIRLIGDTEFVNDVLTGKIK